MCVVSTDCEKQQRLSHVTDRCNVTYLYLFTFDVLHDSPWEGSRASAILPTWARAVP